MLEKMRNYNILTLQDKTAKLYLNESKVNSSSYFIKTIFSKKKHFKSQNITSSTYTKDEYPQKCKTPKLHKGFPISAPHNVHGRVTCGRSTLHHSHTMHNNRTTIYSSTFKAMQLQRCLRGIKCVEYRIFITECYVWDPFGYYYVYICGSDIYLFIYFFS